MSSSRRWGKANAMALEALLHVADHSAAVEIRFFGSETPKEISVSQATRSFFIRDNMVEKREDVVEVDGFSFENSPPLRGRDSGRRVVSNSDEELGFGDVAVICSE